MEETGCANPQGGKEGTRQANESLWTSDEPQWQWSTRQGTAADMKQGSYILMGDIPRRVMRCAHSKSGIHRTRKVHFMLDNGQEDVVLGTTEMTIVTRTLVKQ
jgi:hypothetical protein